ncbi:carboxymuconolactone decarboxylase family protein [Novosphingobium sp. PS1R-30]|uniref:Carboxymuconolactone decarboxylase family protein n=1 Tax=Novosphingobium anseongense TaxID=3133436 RepID=A0ABU8S0S0_9SPHN
MALNSEMRSRIDARHAEVLGQPPRLAPLPRETVGEEVRATTTALLRSIVGPEAPMPDLPVSAIPEIMFTLCRFPSLWQSIMDVTTQIQGPACTVEPRDRKLAILRTGWLCQAPYEFGEHVDQARRMGFDEADIDRIVEGSSAEGWNAHDRAILALVEELHTNAMVSDATWSTLALRLDERQLFELLVIVGQFTATAYFQNALRLRLEGGKGLAAR